MATQKLTQKFVDRLRYEGEPFAVTDTECRGLAVLVHKRSKTYSVKRDVYTKHPDPATGRRRKLGSRRVRLGDVRDFGTVEDARRAAREVINRLRDGEDPRADERPDGQTITLRRAWDEYREYLVAYSKAPATIRDHDATARYFADWMDLTLAEIGRDRPAVRERFRRLTRDHGPAGANRAMRVFRAVYRYQWDLYEELPRDPVKAVVKFNRVEPRDTAMSPEDLPGWWAEVSALSNPLRRDLQLFTLLTGLRAGRDGSRGGGYGVASLRWEHVDWEGRALRLPRTKTKSLDIPLSEPMLEILRRRRADNEPFFPGSPWVFPARSATGHVWSLSERAGERKLVTVTGHALRHTYISLAEVAGVPKSITSRLVGHASGDVTEGYVSTRAQFEFLREAQERISHYLLAQMGHPAVASGNVVAITVS